VDSFYLRACCSVAADLSMALLCGLMMARLWLRRSAEAILLPSLWMPAAAFAIAVAMQVVALAASFTGASSVRLLWMALPDIASTHPGTVLCLTLAAAVVLVILSALSRGGKRYRAALFAVLALCLILRSGSGHAATEAILSLPQALQFLHLAGMAVWSGGVMVSGFYLLPRLQRAQQATVFRDGLASLSVSSTWAVIVTFLAGMAKTWIAAADNFPLLWHSTWTWVLLTKISCVCGALFLGFLNRRWLQTSRQPSVEDLSQPARLLRAEAVLMTLVLILSGLLGNLPPPGE
jgi:putative copper export protein